MLPFSSNIPLWIPFPYWNKKHIKTVEVYEELMRILNEKTHWTLKSPSTGGGYEPESLAWSARKNANTIR